MPASKFRLSGDLAPSPAPVRLAEVMKADLPSMTIALVCTRGQRMRSKRSLSTRAGYLSKSLRNLGPGSLAWMRRMATPCWTRSLRISRNGTKRWRLPFRPFPTWRSLMSAVTIQRNCCVLGTRSAMMRS